MLTLYIGKDWIANSNVIFNKISEDVSQELPGRILIVPELVSHDTERKLCAVAGDTASRFAEVLTFTRLAKRVSDSLGHSTQQCLDAGGRIVAMAAAVRQLHSRLKVYAAVESKPEFLESLIEAVDEFKRCCITSADLMFASQQTEGTLAQKLEELSLILAAYEGICQQGKKDPCDQMTWLLEELEASDFAKNHTFYIDGFPDFTRQHMDILVHLIKESPDVTISMNCDRLDSGKMAFEKAGETASAIYKAARENCVDVEIVEINERKDNLSALRNKVFQGSVDISPKCENLMLYTADTVYQECLIAADEIQSLLRNGARYRDIAVVCTDMAAYGEKLEMVFNRCGIPAYFSGTEPILGRTVIATVLAALDAALGGFETEDVLRYIKSALSPLSMELCDEVENYVSLWSINGKGWVNPWKYHPSGLGYPWEEKTQKELDALEEARCLVMNPLIVLQDAFNKSENLGQQVEALYQFFCTIQLSDRLELLSESLDSKGESRDAQILNQLWDIVISALEQMHDVLGSLSWQTETFSRLFRLLLSQYDVGTIPTVLDSVTVGNVSAMRCHRTKHLIVLGATEGSLPGYNGSTGLLTDRERTELRNMGVPLTGGSVDGLKAEFAEIYGMFCGAEESICLSCITGQPSFVYRRLMSLSGQTDAGHKKAISVVGDALEVGAYLARCGNAQNAEELGILQQYNCINDAVTHRLGSVEEDHIKSLYGSKLHLSASQVDKLADCRFHYFLRYGLRAKERKPATVDPAEFGTYVHAVLENTAREICQLGGFKKVTSQQALDIASKYSEEYINSRFEQLDGERANYLFSRNTKELSLIVHELWDELNHSDFAPEGFEVSFGRDGENPAVDCSGDKIQAELGGFVDRVDSWTSGDSLFYRVVDYKTGKKDFDYCDVFNGLGLQMLIYLFALEDCGENRIPAGVQYFPARVPLIATDGQISDEELLSQRSKNWKRRGLLLNDDSVLSAMANEGSEYRLPISKKKDGSVSGDIATDRQLAMLKSYVFKILAKLVDDVASGNVEPNPYTRGGSHDACSFCPYGSVCHKLTVEDRRNYKAMSAQSFWEYVEREVESDG